MPTVKTTKAPDYALARARNVMGRECALTKSAGRTTSINVQERSDRAQPTLAMEREHARTPLPERVHAPLAKDAAAQDSHAVT